MRMNERTASGPRPLPRARPRSRGFTLIEIIAVVALLALAASTVVFFISRSLSTQQIRGAGRDLVAALRYTRGQAIVKREEQVLELDVEKRAYRAPNRPEMELPKDMEMKLLTAAQEQVDGTTGRVRFFPDGSSTGGRISLIAGERVWQVEIAWLTGEVKLREADR
jgi:general secretion pathway protein H